ncbi:hypothetical protein JCM10207_000309 [Rhodosporidiobolus poonsookiae]
MDDVHGGLLKELESYLSFFKRRQEIEHEYVDALRKLSLKAQQGDRLDENFHSQVPTSWRKAWVAVRNAVEDEARAHRSTAEGLDKVIATLSGFRDNRDRIRRRIKDDLRSTATEHTDYKGVVSRLRKTYERKVEELQHHEEAETLKEEERTGGASNGKTGGKDEAWPPEHWSSSEAPVLPTPAYLRKRSDSAASSKGGASDPDSPPQSVFSPSSNPIFVSGATSSATNPTSGGYRDPPTGKQNVFEAIAKRDWSGEKHRVNSIVRAVGSLAKGTDPAGALGPSRGQRSRQYSGKLKREAEQADREYRAGVFRLETLRLQKHRVQTSARESLHEFVLELATNLKTVSELRVADQISLGHSQVAIGEHVKPEVEKLDAVHDADMFMQEMQDPAPADPPVYYVNAFVGPCKSLLFGTSLQDYHAKHPSLLVPLIVQRCIANVDSHGLELEGIYRIPGKLATIQQIVTRMEKDEEVFQFANTDDPHAVAGVLKLYFRQLPFPLFPFSIADREAFTSDYTASPETATAALIRRLRRLSPAHQATLKAVCEHLARVADHEQVNKMSPSNLGLIFSTVVFGEEETTLESAMQGAKDNVMELLIKQQAVLFEGLPTELPSASRSRRPSGTLANLVPPPSSPPLQPGAAPRAVAPPPSSNTSPPRSIGPTVLPTSSAMRNAGSIDSVYALYQRATAPGVLPGDSSDSAQSSPDVPHGFVPHLATSPVQFVASPSRTPARSNTAPPLSPMSEHSLELRQGDTGSSTPDASRPPSEQQVRPPLPPRTSSSTVQNVDAGSTPPLLSEHQRRPSLPPHPSAATVHDLDTPAPPLSAALGRRVPSPDA